MRAANTPDPITKRDLLYSRRTSPETRIAHGDLAWESGYLDDALEFYTVAGHVRGVGKVKQRAVDEGESVLLLRIERSGLVPVSTDDWRAAAARASQAGRHSQAAVAYARAGDGDKAVLEVKQSPGKESLALVRDNGAA